MKSCSCNGMNENCRHYSGLGYVSDDQPLPTEKIVSGPVPLGISDRPSWSPPHNVSVDVEWERRRRRLAWKNALIALAPYIFVLLAALAIPYLHGC